MIAFEWVVREVSHPDRPRPGSRDDLKQCVVWLGVGVAGWWHWQQERKGQELRSGREGPERP